MLEVAQLRAGVASLSRRRRGPETIADLLVDLLVGHESGPHLTEQLISRYERYIASARMPALRDVQRRNLRQRVDAVAEAIERSGRSVRPELVSALICAVDGAMVAALADDQQDPRTVARSMVIPRGRPTRRIRNRCLFQTRRATTLSVSICLRSSKRGSPEWRSSRS